MTVAMPARTPARPFFSSGPCAKPPGWTPEKLATESLGRSHRAKIGKTRLQYCIDLMRDVGLERADQVERARNAVDERHHVHAKTGLQRRELEEVVQHDIGIRVALQRNDEARGVAG